MKIYLSPVSCFNTPKGFIRIFGGDGIVGGSTQIKGSGNVTVSTDSEGIGYLNIHGALNNSLTSTATNEALTARQGKILKDLIDQLDVSGKYDKTGGIISGNVTINAALNFGSFSLNDENGYIPLGNGFIYQFGYIALSDMTVINPVTGGQYERYAEIDLPIDFPHQAINPTATIKATNTGVLSDLFAQIVNITNTQITLKTATINGGDNSDGIEGVYWSVLGH